jgi:hypothetical protein
MNTPNPERPWADAAPSISLTWIMTNEGLRMRWTLEPALPAELRITLKRIAEDLDDSAA